MIATHTQRILLPTLLGIVALLFAPAIVHGAQAPVKEIVSSHFGREVNLTEAGKGPALENVCTVASKDECQAGRASSEPGGLTEAESFAVAPNGNVYVAEGVNGRVQELTSTGSFVGVFGEGVITPGAVGTGDLVSGSATVSSVITTSRVFLVGQTITGIGVPVGSRIVAVGPGTLTLSHPATASGTNVALTVAAGAGGVPTNEQQVVTVKATGGSFALEFAMPDPSSIEASTGEIPFDATAGEVQSALQALPSIGAGNVVVSGSKGGPYTVTFQGALADTNVGQLQQDSSKLTGGAHQAEHQAEVFTSQNGGGSFEVCTISTDCQAGSEGTSTGEFKERVSVSVDPSTGNVYVADGANNRVQEFTEDGEFVLMFGKEVNATTKGNVCTAVSKNTCKAGVEGAEPGAFHFAAGFSTAVGGPEDLLFVGEEGRVQRFEADGVQVGETPTACTVGALAVDPTGDMYVVCSIDGDNGNVIQELSPSGEEIKHFALPMRRTGAQQLNIDAIALDAAGQLAITETEITSEDFHRGGLYNIVNATSLHLVTEFTNEFSTGASPPEPATVGSNDIAIGAKDELYALIAFGFLDNEVVAYRPVPVAELAASPAVCVSGPVVETDVTSNCHLVGMVDPWGVKETEVSFEWGRSIGLGEKTSPTSKITNTKSEGEEEAPPVEVTAPIEGLRPNETFYFRATAQDENVKTPESLTSETVSFNTPSVPPRIVGEHDASFVSSSSAVLFGELNPENTPTEYFFEYGPCPELAGCETISRTGALGSPVYGKIGVTLEATGLQPSTTYSYRLSGVNKPLAGTGEAMVNETGGAQLPEGSFTTAPAPLPQATTGAASAIGSTSALIAGMVDPDGQPATYVFELGVYAGGETRYGIVFSGPAGEGTTPSQRTLGVSGLQPGTTYAYRVVVKSGYGTAVGEPVLFTTTGLPAVLVVPAVLAQLPVPNIAFPNPTVPIPPKTAVKAKALTSAQKLTRALKACKQRPRSKRAACEKQAREQYAKSKQATKRKKG